MQQLQQSCNRAATELLFVHARQILWRIRNLSTQQLQQAATELQQSCRIRNLSTQQSGHLSMYKLLVYAALSY